MEWIIDNVVAIIVGIGTFIIGILQLRRAKKDVSKNITHITQNDSNNAQTQTKNITNIIQKGSNNTQTNNITNDNA